MGVQFDLIIPPVIVGFIILTLFSIHSFMMETSVDNRLSAEMQSFADNTTILLQNELRTLESITSLTDSTIRFVTTRKDTVHIYRQGRKLIITRTAAATSVTNTDEYAARLKSLTFNGKQQIKNVPSLLHFQVITESRAEQHVGGANDNTVRAYAEKQVFLRNVFYN